MAIMYEQEEGRNSNDTNAVIVLELVDEAIDVKHIDLKSSLNI